jgi:hypothetical protein
MAFLVATALAMRTGPAVEVIHGKTKSVPQRFWQMRELLQLYCLLHTKSCPIVNQRSGLLRVRTAELFRGGVFSLQ